MDSTAFLAAAARAAHLLVDSPPYVFTDPWATELLGDRADELIDYHRLHGDHLVLAGARVQAVVRSRVAEDALAASGADQYVILGAGLDSYAYRAADGMSVFEVDHPSFKKPASPARLVPVDLERELPMAALRAAGLDPHRPVFVSWLGVTMYLTSDAIAATVRDLCALPSGSHLVLDFMLPAELRDEAGQTYVDLVGPDTAERGEPWRSFWSPDEMAAALAGFGPATMISQHDVLTEPRTDALNPARLTMIAHAVRN
jgi:methyltransferase (TIGR00027 family)